MIEKQRIDVAAGLRQLATLLREIKALAEWGKLVAHERARNKSTEIFVDHNLESALRNACDMFIKLAMGLHDVLRWKDPMKPEVARYRRRYRTLVRQFQFLGTGVRAIDSRDTI